MIAKLASGGSQKSSGSSTGAGTMSAAQLKRKRTKLLDLLLNTNWSKQSQQVTNLMRLNKILICCDANFLDEKSGESPLSLAITSTQINSPLSAGHLASATLGCAQSSSLFNLQNHHSSSSHNQFTLRQTSAVELSQSKGPPVERIILLLIKNGAKVDFRNSDTKTPLHVAAMKSNFWALKILLELGASTDHRDINGLTPLYYSILHGAELKVTHLLLNYSNRNPSNLSPATSFNGTTATTTTTTTQLAPVDGAGNNDANGQNKSIGITDQQGWQEVHHACKLGLDAHLDKLLYHGCDINAKISGSGNTPLHVAAINDQLNCAKVLLLRGADKTITNNSHQTAHQVAVISNNMDLAEFIAEHDETKVVPFAERPAPVLAAPIVAPPSSGGAFAHQRHSFALPKAYNAINNLNRFSISSAQHLVSSKSSNNLLIQHSGGGGGGNSNSSNNNHRHHVTTNSSNSNRASQQQTQQYQCTTLARATGLPQQRQLNPLMLDVSGAGAHESGSAASSAPTSASGISSGIGCALVAKTSLLSINANQPSQLSNISPSLSQRSCATTNTTATSSSGVCCDGDAHNSAEELAQAQNRSNRSNITVISIGNGSSNGVLPSRAVAGLNSFLPQSGEPNLQQSGGAINEPRAKANLDDAVVAATAATATAYDDGDDNEDDEDLKSTASSNGLCSLISDERPLFAGSIVEATSEFQSGDPTHLQLRRGNLIEVLEYPAEMIQAGQLPRLANKLMLFGRLQSDGTLGLFPSFCVRRTRRGRASLGQRIAMTDITNDTAIEQPPALAQPSNHLTESQSTLGLGSVTSSQHNSNGTGSQADSSPLAITRFRELKVNLIKINEGFGFVLRGARINPATLGTTQADLPRSGAKIPIDERLMAANNLASLQYLDDIEPGSVAERAGLKRGDFLVAVNQCDVRMCSHEQVVQMIRQSGDRVDLTIATPELEHSTQCQYATLGSKTLGRKKPEPPKRDPATTLTRNKTQRVKPMPVAPMMRQENHFDHSKPLPVAPNQVVSCSSSSLASSGGPSFPSQQFGLNCTASVQSLNSSAAETQSISSLSTMDSRASQQQTLSPRDQNPTPIQSSSSTTTLTTVATTKPKAPVKPSYLQASNHMSAVSDQAAFQSAIITTTKRPQNSSPVRAGPMSSATPGGGAPQDALTTSNAGPSQSAPPPPPPPPPPMPNFSTGSSTISNRLNQRRTSVPVNLESQSSDASRTLKRRESLANSSTTAAANISSVAAACAAAANDRLLRQQRKESLKTMSNEDREESGAYAEESSSAARKIDEENLCNGLESNVCVREQITPPIKTTTEFPPPPLPSLPPPSPPPPPPPLEFDQLDLNLKTTTGNGTTGKRAVMSATLGRKFPAQIIQQPKLNGVSQSQTLRAKPKRPSILNYGGGELTTGPDVGERRSLEGKLKRAGAGDQQLLANDCQHVHVQEQAQGNCSKQHSSNRATDGIASEMRQSELATRKQAQAMRIAHHEQQQRAHQQQLLLQHQHQRILQHREQERRPQVHHPDDHNEVSLINAQQPLRNDQSCRHHHQLMEQVVSQERPVDDALVRQTLRASNHARLSQLPLDQQTQQHSHQHQHRHHHHALDELTALTPRHEQYHHPQQHSYQQQQEQQQHHRHHHHHHHHQQPYQQHHHHQHHQSLPHEQHQFTAARHVPINHHHSEQQPGYSHNLHTHHQRRHHHNHSHRSNHVQPQTVLQENQASNVMIPNNLYATKSELSHYSQHDRRICQQVVVHQHPQQQQYTNDHYMPIVYASNSFASYDN